MIQPSLEPLVRFIEVNCSQAAAFDLWVFKPSTWWPMSNHTTFGADATAVVFEPGIKGRIYEQNDAGMQREWGRITDWRPPSSVAFTWHIYGSAEEATDVEVSFKRLDEEHTRVTITHSGWERLAERAAEIRDGNKTGWTDLLAAFSTVIALYKTLSLDGRDGEI